MIFGLDIKQIAETIYHVPLVYILFYYFVVFIVAAIVKKVMNIEMDSRADFGIFKIDRNSLPTLLLIAWFGLMYRFLLWVSLFESPVLTSLICALIFIIVIIGLKELQSVIQKFVLLSNLNKKKQNIQTPGVRERLRYYAEYESERKKYNFLLVSALLTAFCIVFSFLEFGIYSGLITVALLLVYWIIVCSEKLESIREGLKNW